MYDTFICHFYFGAVVKLVEATFLANWAQLLDAVIYPPSAQETASFFLPPTNERVARAFGGKTERPFLLLRQDCCVLQSLCVF